MDFTPAQLDRLSRVPASLNNVKSAIKWGLGFDQCIEVAAANGDPYEVARSLNQDFSFDMAMAVVKEDLLPRFASKAYQAGMSLQAILGDCPAPGLLMQVAKTVLEQPDRLNMEVVDNYDLQCGTTRCLAGWAIKLHPDGPGLKRLVGWEIAGRSLLGHEAASYFHKQNAEALAFLEKIASKTALAA